MSNPHITRISPTALRVYQQCPKAYRHQYVDRDDRAVTQPTAALVVGAAVHEALALFYGLPAAERDEPMLHRALRHVWPKHRDARALPTRQAEVEAGIRALTLLSTYWRELSDGEQVLAREEWVDYSLSTGVCMVGRVDRIDDAGSKGLDVIDYKTGMQELSEQELADDPAALIYLHAVEATHRRPVRAVRFLYLNSGREVRWSPTAAERAHASAGLSERLAGLQLDREFQATPGPACRFCPVRRDCRERGRVRAVDLRVAADLPF